MRNAISDTIRSAGRQLRSNNTDERFVVQFQMRLLGGVIKGFINRSHDVKVPALRGFASSLIRKDFIDLCKGSGVLPEVSGEWIQSAGKALFSGTREHALEYANQLANLDKAIFEAKEPT